MLAAQTPMQFYVSFVFFLHPTLEEASHQCSGWNHSMESQPLDNTSFDCP
jgi:hypothetical protein